MIWESLQLKNEMNDLRLLYVERDYAFDIEPVTRGAYTSVVINDLSIDIDEHGKVL